ncbi:hypothetical protein HZB02_04295 [Candidatus Woesearchaeota archaeon]|nr:hypothetical protein [Candidatus Woesearchaeota archaeon]
MHPILQALDAAESTFREAAKTEFPLFADIPIVKAPEDQNNKRHWMFYTDLKEIHLDVFKPDDVDRLFDEEILPRYAAAFPTQLPPEALKKRLVHDNFLYLDNHELFHPVFCPNSKSDEELVDKALYEGIRKTEPSRSREQTLAKVGNVRNAAWDQVIDTEQFHAFTQGSLEQRLANLLPAAHPTAPLPHMPDGVISIFDVIELAYSKEQDKKEKFDSLFYPLTRAVYAYLFTESHTMRKPLVDYFKDQILKQMTAKNYEAVITAALDGFILSLTQQQLQLARINPATYQADVHNLVSNYDQPTVDASHTRLIDNIRTVLTDTQCRYDALYGFIQPLAPYISLSKEEKRHGTHMQGTGQGTGQSTPNQTGGNAEQALQNLANALDPKEAQQLLSEVGNSPGGIGAGSGTKEARLTNLARDEFYKRSSPAIPIKSAKYEPMSVDLGKRLVPVHIQTRHLRPEDVVNLNLDKILEFQQETGITQLFQLSEQVYQFDVYGWQEFQDTDVTYAPTGLELPANVILHVDSSSSMGDPAYVNTNQKYDTLMHVCIGLLKTLYKAKNEMQKPVWVRSANFSNGTILSNAIELSEMYETPNNEAKTVLMGFQNGGTTYTATAFDTIASENKPGKTVHIFATDGGLHSDCQESTYQAIERTARLPDTSILYFEIQTQSNFGNRISELAQRYPNVKYYPNVTLKTVQDRSLEVMIEYA